MSDRLQGKVAVITGAASGIGAGTARRPVALELAPRGVRVNAISPGGIATNIFAPGFARAGLEGGQNADVAELMRPALARMQPIPRAGEPDDIAAMALYLASDESTFVSGQAFVADGALTAGKPRDPERDNMVARAYQDTAAAGRAPETGG